MTRSLWDEVWANVATAIASRSNCELAKIGAVIVSDKNRAIATGYNGPPSGLNKKCATGCLRYTRDERTESYSTCISIHAEANALLFCDRNDREDGTMYVTSAPCIGCAKLIANSGLKRVIITEPIDEHAHRDPYAGMDMIMDSGLEYICWTPN